MKHLHLSGFCIALSALAAAVLLVGLTSTPAQAQCLTPTGDLSGQTATMVIVDGCGTYHHSPNHDMGNGPAFCPNTAPGCNSISQAGWQFPSGTYLVSPNSGPSQFVIPELQNGGPIDTHEVEMILNEMVFILP